MTTPEWKHLGGIPEEIAPSLALQMLEIWLSSWEVVWKWKFTHTCKLRNMIIFSHDPRNCHMIQGNRGVAFAPGHRVGRAVTLRLQVTGWGGHARWGGLSCASIGILQELKLLISTLATFIFVFCSLSPWLWTSPNLSHQNVSLCLLDLFEFL